MERLAEILADMVLSALAWEKEHGHPPKPAECRLTPSFCGHRVAADNIEPGGNKGGDRENDNQGKPDKDV